MAAANISRPGVLLLKEGVFSLPIVDHVIATFDPSLGKLRAGEVTIVTSNSDTDSTFDDLAKHPENKPGDIVIYLSMTPEERGRYLGIIRRGSPPSDEDAASNRFKVQNILGCVMMEYLMHGSLANLNAPKPQVPEFALKATSLRHEDFTRDKLTSTPAFYVLKFTAALRQFHDLLPQMPLTMQSRLKLGFAGNRLFAILGLMKVQLVGKHADTTPIGFLLKDDILKGAPYLSFHPDHPDNPMRDASKKFMAYLGEEYTKAGGKLDELHKRNPALFIPGVMANLKADLSIVPGHLPSVDKLKEATQEFYSIPFILS